MFQQSPDVSSRCKQAAARIDHPRCTSEQLLKVNSLKRKSRTTENVTDIKTRDIRDVWLCWGMLRVGMLSRCADTGEKHIALWSFFPFFPGHHHSTTSVVLSCSFYMCCDDPVMYPVSGIITASAWRHGTCIASSLALMSRSRPKRCASPIRGALEDLWLLTTHRHTQAIFTSDARCNRKIIARNSEKVAHRT